MRILLLTAIAVLTSLSLFAQPVLDETHVEGYIIDKKGKRSEGILLLNGDPELHPFLNQNKVGFMTKKKWDGLVKVKNKEFDTKKGKDIQEYGFGEVRYLTSKWISIDGTADPIAAGKKMFYEVLTDNEVYTLFRIWPSVQGFIGTDGEIMSDGAILLPGMKAPKVWDQFNYMKWFGDCPEIVENIEAGDYAPITKRTGKVSLGGMVTKELMNITDENGMPKGLNQALKLLEDSEEACKK